MHYYLRNALRDMIARLDRPDPHRTPEEQARAARVVRTARRLLLHDQPTALVERWLDARDRDGEAWTGK